LIKSLSISRVDGEAVNKKAFGFLEFTLLEMIGRPVLLVRAAARSQHLDRMTAGAQSGGNLPRLLFGAPF
jgi:hypothetical protein